MLAACTLAILQAHAAHAFTSRTASLADILPSAEDAFGGRYTAPSNLLDEVLYVDLTDPDKEDFLEALAVGFHASWRREGDTLHLYRTPDQSNQILEEHVRLYSASVSRFLQAASDPSSNNAPFNAKLLAEQIGQFLESLSTGAPPSNRNLDILDTQKLTKSLHGAILSDLGSDDLLRMATSQGLFLSTATQSGLKPLPSASRQRLGEYNDLLGKLSAELGAISPSVQKAAGLTPDLLPAKEIRELIVFLQLRRGRIHSVLYGYSPDGRSTGVSTLSIPLESDVNPAINIESELSLSPTTQKVVDILRQRDDSHLKKGLLNLISAGWSLERDPLSYTAAETVRHIAGKRSVIAILPDSLHRLDYLTPVNGKIQPSQLLPTTGRELFLHPSDSMLVIGPRSRIVCESFRLPRPALATLVKSQSGEPRRDWRFDDYAIFCANAGPYGSDSQISDSALRLLVASEAFASEEMHPLAPRSIAPYGALRVRKTGEDRPLQASRIDKEILNQFLMSSLIEHPPHLSDFDVNPGILISQRQDGERGVLWSRLPSYQYSLAGSSGPWSGARDFLSQCRDRGNGAAPLQWLSTQSFHVKGKSEPRILLTSPAGWQAMLPIGKWSEEKIAVEKISQLPQRAFEELQRSLVD